MTLTEAIADVLSAEGGGLNAREIAGQLRRHERFARITKSDVNSALYAAASQFSRTAPHRLCGICVRAVPRGCREAQSQGAGQGDKEGCQEGDEEGPSEGDQEDSCLSA